jgi:hypothetical protein
MEGIAPAVFSELRKIAVFVQNSGNRSQTLILKVFVIVNFFIRRGEI